MVDLFASNNFVFLKLLKNEVLFCLNTSYQLNSTKRTLSQYSENFVVLQLDSLGRLKN